MNGSSYKLFPLRNNVAVSLVLASLFAKSQLLQACLSCCIIYKIYTPLHAQQIANFKRNLLCRCLGGPVAIVYSTPEYDT